MAAITCPKCQSPLKTVLTRASVVIDRCPGCRGAWLDGGEIRFLAKNPKALAPYLASGLEKKEPTPLGCPRCRQGLAAGFLPGFRFQVEECPGCRGLFLDAHEFEKLAGEGLFARARPDAKIAQARAPSAADGAAAAAGASLPSLGFVSTAVLTAMYAVVFGLLVFLVEIGTLSSLLSLVIAVGFVLAQFMVGPIIMDWSLRLFGSLDWVEPGALPPHARAAFMNVCTKEGIPLPRIGIIDDGSPQAYTYGRTPWSARVVLSRGLLEILEPDESAAVIAHELGHVRNWDFVVMTIAQLVPVLLYHIYRFCLQVSRRGGGGRKGGAAGIVAAAVIAYVAYIVSSYLVLFISRLREYWADRFAADATGKPNSLVTALVKIAFGLLSSEPSEKAALDAAKDKPKGPNPALSRARAKTAVQAMGIMSVSGSREVALAYQGDLSRGLDPAEIQDVMQWDLWSPWAKLYEIMSTHPLSAKRINALSAQAIRMGQRPVVSFSRVRPESYWDDFAADLVTWALPALGAGAGAAGWYLFRASLGGYAEAVFALFFASIGFAVGGTIRQFRSYPMGGAPLHAIASLLKSVKVSPVRSYAVTVKGKVIGRGDAGSLFNEDMVIRDATGIIYLDYEQPLNLINLWFALFRMDKFRGQEVEVTGWYRRAPIPFIEVRTIRSPLDQSRSLMYELGYLGYLCTPIVVLLGTRMWLGAGP